MKRDTTVVVRLKASTKEGLQILAEADKRTMSDYVRLVLEALIKKRLGREP